MEHLTPEHLAGQALGHPELLTEAQLGHLASCPDCQSEVDVLARTATVARGGIAQPPMMPGPHVWERIAAEVADDRGAGHGADPLATRPSGGAPVPTSPVSPREQPALPPRAGVPRRAVRTRPRWAMVLVAAGLGLVIGVGGTVLVDLIGGRSDVVASAALDPLPGHTGRGTAELIRTSGTTELRVQVESATPSEDYRELWLINTDLKRMYSLGVLPTSGTGTYPVPAQLDGGLDGFTIVDVSVEPYDGNALHSRNSLVRGVLPT